MPELSIVRTKILHPYVAFSSKNGLPHDALLKRAALPVYFRDFPDSWLSYAKVQMFIEHMLDLEPEAESALSGFLTDPDKSLHPAMWEMIRNSVTLFQALEGLERFSREHISDFRSHLFIGDDNVRFGFKLPVVLSKHRRAAGVQESRSLEMLVGIIKFFSRSRFRIRRAFLMSRSETVKSNIEKSLGGIPVFTGEAFSGVEFPKSLLSCHVTKDERPHSRQVKNDYRENPDLSELLTLILEAYLPEQHPSISLAAEIAGTSVRTLQRRLADLGTTYEQIIEGIRCKMALRLIEEESLSYNELAHLLGYSEHSAFSRAFSRWTGMAPKEYRFNRLSIKG